MNHATLETPRASAPSGRPLEGPYLTFRLGALSCGISLLFAQEVIEMPRVEPRPDVPDYVRGVLNLRGMVLPVIDLRLRLQVPPRIDDAPSCVIIIRIIPPGGHSTPIGLVVDDVESVADIDDEGMERTSRFQSPLRAGCIAEMAPIQGKMTVLLDLHAILFADPLEDIPALAC